MENRYTLDPSTIKFDDKYVVFNPLQSEEEYEATLASMQRLGQREPILMLDGRCVDGRHRTKAAIELGIPVLCTDVAPGTSEEDLILLCNTNVTSGRDYDNSQKAIQALNLTRDYKIMAKDAATMFKIDKRMVSYAATIRGYNREDILTALVSDKKAKVQVAGMERPSRSLEVIAKFVKAESEEHLVVIDDSERVQWKPDALIKTESGKAWYYEQIEIAKTAGSTHYEKLLVEMANLKFKLAEKAADV